MSFHSAVSVKVFVALIFISGGRHAEQNLRGSEPESEFPINDRSPAQASTPHSTVPVESPSLVEMETNLGKVGSLQRRHYANQPAHTFFPLHQQPNFTYVHIIHACIA